MARQKGVMTLSGKAGTFSFFQGRNGFGARSSDGMNGKRIQEDAAFARTRENGREFGRAGRAGKLLRTALRILLLTVADNRMTSRMTKEMLKVVQSDPVNGRGDRTAEKGDATLLTGFEFNATNPLAQVFFPEVKASIDRTTGKGEVVIPAYIPDKMILPTKGATHYSFLIGLVSADFALGKSVQTLLSVPPRELLRDEVAGETLTVTLPESTDHPMFLAFGIEFLQFVNGKRYELNDSRHNALSLVAVDGDI